MKKLFIIAAVTAFSFGCGDDNKEHKNNGGAIDQPSNSVDSVEDNHGVNDEPEHNDGDSVPATPPGERTPR